MQLGKDLLRISVRLIITQQIQREIAKTLFSLVQRANTIYITLCFSLIFNHAIVICCMCYLQNKSTWLSLMYHTETHLFEKIYSWLASLWTTRVINLLLITTIFSVNKWQKCMIEDLPNLMECQRSIRLQINSFSHFTWQPTVMSFLLS